MEKKHPFLLLKPRLQEPTDSQVRNQTQPAQPTETQFTVAFAASKKRKLSSENPKNSSARKRVRCEKPAKNKEIMQWGYSLDLMLYDDPWKIKKSLMQTDLGDHWCRLLIPTNMAEQLILPVLDVKTDDSALTKEGISVTIWDVDTESEYKLIFKRWVSSAAYIFYGLSWKENFVQRRDLKVRDEIGFHWDPYKKRFDFSVLKKAVTTM